MAGLVHRRLGPGPGDATPPLRRSPPAALAGGLLGARLGARWSLPFLVTASLVLTIVWFLVAWTVIEDESGCPRARIYC